MSLLARFVELNLLSQFFRFGHQLCVLPYIAIAHRVHGGFLLLGIRLLQFFCRVLFK